MKAKIITLSLGILASINILSAQETSRNFTPSENRHEIRLSMSDGLTLSSSNILGTGISDAILGTKRSSQKNTWVFGLGYRYSIKRFRIGADLGFARMTAETALKGEEKASIKENDLNFLVLPAGEYTYFRRGLVELYGSAAAGVNISRHSESPIGKTAGKNELAKPYTSVNFAYQVNPIAIRVGNDRIGGFVEAGLGHKGFVTAGLSLKF